MNGEVRAKFAGPHGCYESHSYMPLTGEPGLKWCDGGREVRLREVTLYEPFPADDTSVTYVGNEPTWQPVVYRPVQALIEVVPDE